MTSPFLPVGLSVAALLASLSRWFVQASGNLYTALEKRFYIPDPNLGWRVTAARGHFPTEPDGSLARSTFPHLHG